MMLIKFDMNKALRPKLINVWYFPVMCVCVCVPTSCAWVLNAWLDWQTADCWCSDYGSILYFSLKAWIRYT